MDVLQDRCMIWNLPRQSTRKEVNVISSHMSNRRRHRAATLIEAVLYVSIALALIVGGLVFFQQASNAARTSNLVRQLSAVLAEARILIKGHPLNLFAFWNFDDTDITPYLIAAGAFPGATANSVSTVSNPFGGTIRVGAALWEFLAWEGDPLTQAQGPYDVLMVQLTEVPQSVCTRLVAGQSSVGPYTHTIVSSGQFSVMVAPTGNLESGNEFSMTLSQAAITCKYGSQAHRDAGIDGIPTTPPIEGPVDVWLMFAVEA
jgi:hypothetical protein